MLKINRRERRRGEMADATDLESVAARLANYFPLADVRTLVNTKGHHRRSEGQHCVNRLIPRAPARRVCGKNSNSESTSVRPREHRAGLSGKGPSFAAILPSASGLLQW